MSESQCHTPAKKIVLQDKNRKAALTCCLVKFKTSDTIPVSSDTRIELDSPQCCRDVEAQIMRAISGSAD